MASRPIRVAGLLFALSGAWAQPAPAHPHVWIEARAELDFTDGRVAAIAVEWTFDPMFSQVLIQDFDVDIDGVLNEHEQAALQREAFADVRDFGYFTHLRVGGRPVPFDRATEFGARIDGERTDGRLVYRFRLPLPEPADPRTAPVTVGLYDPEYYVEVGYDDAAIALTGEGSAGCRTEIGVDEAHPIYYGLVLPRKIDLVCPAS